MVDSCSYETICFDNYMIIITIFILSHYHLLVRFSFLLPYYCPSIQNLALKTEQLCGRMVWNVLGGVGAELVHGAVDLAG